MVNNIRSSWVGAEIKILEPINGYNINDIVTCKTDVGGMITIENNKSTKSFFRKDRFELVGKIKRAQHSSGFGYIRPIYEKRKIHNKLTKQNALNDCKEWPDEHLIEIYEQDIDVPIEEFPNPIIDNLCSKFKRTYYAVEEQVRFAYNYKLDREIRDFYYKERNPQELKRIGAQMVRLMDNIINKQQSI